jgi:hypothetical protein
MLDQIVNVTPNFSISATLSSCTFGKGSSATYAVIVTPSGSFTGNVTFSVTGIPPRSSFNFELTSVSGRRSSTLTITIGKNTAKKTYVLTILGTSGSLKSLTTFELKVD